MAEATGVKLKCSGAYSAYIEIDSLLVTVGALKEVIADGMGIHTTTFPPHPPFDRHNTWRYFVARWASFK